MPLSLLAFTLPPASAQPPIETDQPSIHIMKTESLLQRARGGLLSPIVRAMNSIEEIIQSSDQDRDKLLDALISLFVLVLKADGHVSEAELQAVSRALRDEHGEAAVKKLQEKVDADTLPNTKDAVLHWSICLPMIERCFFTAFSSLATPTTSTAYLSRKPCAK